MARVGLIGENSLEYINALLSIWNNGDCAVLIDWRIPLTAAVTMMKEAGVEIFYIEKRFLNDVENYDINFQSYEVSTNNATLLPEIIYEKFMTNYSRDEAVILYSSGTTGKAKGIILTHYAINTNADAIIDYMQPTENDCIYITKTLSHSSTLTGELLVALKSKIKLLISPVIIPPRITLDNICQFNVTLVCVNPTLLKTYAEEVNRSSTDLPSLRTIFVSGSILNDKIYKLAHDTFRVPIYNVYGLSEAAPRVTAQTADCCTSNSVGKPIKGLKIKIVDEDGREVGCGERGIIHVNTPSRFSGYVTGNEKLPSLYEGLLNSGDIGYVDGYGELHIVGREDDVIIINSHKIYPGEVERQILQVDGVSECAVVKLMYNDNEFIACMYVAKDDLTADIKERLKGIFMFREIPSVFKQADALPTNKNGKINRVEVVKVLQGGL